MCSITDMYVLNTHECIPSIYILAHTPKQKSTAKSTKI